MVVAESITQECSVKVVNILFILWIIVFAFWLAGQFRAHNERTDKD